MRLADEVPPYGHFACARDITKRRSNLAFDKRLLKLLNEKILRTFLQNLVNFLDPSLTSRRSFKDLGFKV